MTDPTPPAPGPTTPAPYVVLDRGEPCGEGALDAGAPDEQGEGAPLVSCMMVTRRRARLAARAIRCFQEQTDPDKELVIVDDDDDDTLARRVAELSDRRIVHVRVPPTNLPLGALRNLAMRRARGAFVCQWDDDDLSHVRRLSLEMAAIAASGAEACFLARHRLLWLGGPSSGQRLGTSGRRLWEGSMLCAKGRVPRYPAVKRGEDTPVARYIEAAERVVLLDAPELYTYVFHGKNTFDEEHHLWIRRRATEQYEGAEHALRMNELLLGLPADVARDLAAEAGAPPPGPR